MRRALLLALIGWPALAGAADAPPFRSALVSDAELSDMRGGFTLPGGIEVAIAVRTETLVSGATVLLSEYRIDDGAPNLSVFVPKVSAPSSSAPTPADAADASASSFRDHTLAITPAVRTGVHVNVGPTDSGGAARSDLTALSLAPGESAATPAGLVSVTGTALRQVRLLSNTLDTRHFFGSALGSLTVNTGNDRVIDTVTSIDIDLANVTPDVLGSALLRAEGVAFDAAATLATQGGF